MSKKKFLKELAEFEPIIKAESRKHYIPGMTWEDIAQEIRLKLWIKWRLFDKEKAGFKTWANKVMKNTIRNLARQSKTQKSRILNEFVPLEFLKKNDENE